jgi:rhodanese-related sulfurtransferase
MLSGSYERQNRLNNHCCNERQQPITEITALSNLECQQQSADINNPPVFVHSSGKQPPQPAINTRCSSPDQTAVTMTYGNANYEYTTTTRSTSDLFTFSSIADYGLTSPDAKSSLCFDNDVCQQSTAIKTPLSRINHVHSDLRVSKPSDTPYQRRHRLLERAALPILADNILDMRLCSSPAPLEVSLNSSGEIHRLPSQHSPKDTIRRITPQTMVNVLDGVYQSCYNQLLIIDCRYPYEYLGGHIPGAININTPDAIDRLLLENPDKSSHTCIVFHCEFSSQRAPRMALHVRNFDRLLNSDRYPHLHYPEIYILDGGYKAFYDSFSVPLCHEERLTNPCVLGTL